MTEIRRIALPPTPVKNPKGIPVADPKFHRPLYKLMGLMLHPHSKPFSKKSTRSKREQPKIKFY